MSRHDKLGAPDTVLWFEFLLDPDLITKHLKKEFPQPSAVELINQFVGMSSDNVVGQYDLSSPDSDAVPGGIPVTPGTGAVATETEGGLNVSRKQIALKVLTLKVCTHLKWDLDLIERGLPIPKQIILLKDLCAMCFGKVVPIPLPVDFKVQLGLGGDGRAANFALALFHRWVLRLQVVKDVVMKLARIPMGNVIEPLNQLIAPDIPPQPSVDYLQELCKSNEPFYVFSYDTFLVLHPGANEEYQNFDTMQKISPAELHAQINYDLVKYYQYTKQPMLAFSAVRECLNNFNLVKADMAKRSKTINDCYFLTISESSLDAMLLMCGLNPGCVTLENRLAFSQVATFEQIENIFAEDNRADEIPCELRQLALRKYEMQVSQNVVKSSQDSDMHAAALNVVKRVIRDDDKYFDDYFDKYRERAGFLKTLGNAIADVLPSCMPDVRQRMKNVLTECILNYGEKNKDFVQQVKRFDLFTAEEWKRFEESFTETELKVPALLTQNDWKCNTRLPFLDAISLERQLISCPNAHNVRKLLVRLAATNPTKPLWAVNPSWEIPTPLKTLLMSMQRGFLQDFAYVLLGKAREMTAKKDFNNACTMLYVLKSETNRPDIASIPQVQKLGKMVIWEILLIQITQCLEEWNKKTVDLQVLGTRCKQCLGALQNGDNVMPRIEIIECCAVMLLNLTDWNTLMFLIADKRFPQLELPIAVAGTFIEMEKMKGQKKVCRDAWDIVLSMFLNTSKRGYGGGGGGGAQGSSRNSPNLAVSSGLQPFLKRIRHSSLFSLFISLFGKIHNILKDDPNHDLSGEYMQLWPTSISNPISYSIRSVSETLHWLLTEALRFYPQTISWLKMKGDLELAIGNNEAAMRNYMDALVTSTDYFSVPLQRSVADDHLIRKMIRCCSNLGCHMQATVLCQFLEEIDYGIVFKNLSEKSSNFTDAVDAYYDCIWDTTLLEFIINLHSKKGELSRKQEAMSKMGELELNANNNEEIKREAAAVRKNRFLRALAKQYLG